MWKRVSGVCIDIHLTETWCKVSTQDVCGQGAGRGWLPQRDGRDFKHRDTAGAGWSLEGTELLVAFRKAEDPEGGT